MPVRVNVISESSYTVKGHGVHSVYEDNLEALRDIGGLKVFSRLFVRTDIVHLHTVGPVAALLMRYSAPTSVVTAHVTPESLAGSLVGGRLFAGLAERYLRWFYNQADSVIALSSHAKSGLVNMGVTSPVTVVPNVVPKWQQNEAVPRQDAKRAIGIPEKKKIILSVGQVQPRKAVPTFYKCAKDIPEAVFIWVGGFPFSILTSRYWEMRRIMKSKPCNVIHTGRLNRKDVRAYYGASDVYFHPSYHELGPVAVLEAASHGLPLVLRDLRCYRDAPSGSYVAGTEHLFTAQLRSLIEDGILLRRMSEGAAGWAASLPSSRSGEALRSLYERLLSQSGSPRN
jgi:1,2-diacylglycerol-3-alpha-glucose alpha-1,2-galactosyltransferase